MARLNRFTKEETLEEKKVVASAERIKMIHYSQLITGRYQYRDKGKTQEQLHEEIMDMALWIELAGGILEPVLVRKLDVDKYEIIAGHTRTGGSRYLVEQQGKLEYAFVPCIVKTMSDADAEANTSFSNARKPATQAEILHEIEIAKKRLESYPNPELKGRFVERFAKKYHMTPSVVGDYINISKNLGEECKKAFENGELKKSAAVALASLPETEQNELLHAGVTSHKAIKQYKAEKDIPKEVKQADSVEKDNKKDIEDIIKVKNKPSEKHIIQEKVTESNVHELQNESIQIRCSICNSLVFISDTFQFKEKRYCKHCLYELLKALSKSGKIVMYADDKEKKGCIII